MHLNTSRRRFLSGLAAGCALPAPMLLAQSEQVEVKTQRNISSFRMHRWQDHFDNLENGVILSDTTSRMLQYWSEDGTVAKIYPTSVPLSDDLTRLGYTRVVRKVDGPSWRPTPSMKKRNPEWPDYVGPGPQNPLGTHALYLSWQYYRIHGTNDTRKIGRRSSNGCIGLYNEKIAELFALAKVGTQVKLI
ncbi:L,D-transpeptidase [Aliiroseovarius sp. PrR006]|uniref:L,D-transpeptidase n=1 Tax=Aliiroseovarius sp. PrR006 TaxID=2706883 RepID=UPI0013D3E426|nr:L,D-transpeptidase [Aliiroseovarius sp. PrR006]